jgi:hypothetical protein
MSEKVEGLDQNGDLAFPKGEAEREPDAKQSFALHPESRDEARATSSSPVGNTPRARNPQAAHSFALALTF